MIGLSTAMRRSEILALRWENVNLDRRLIYLPKAETGPREVPMTGALADYLRSYPRTSSWLFTSKRSKTGHLVAIEGIYRRAVASVGLDPKQVVRHTLRHSAVTHLVQAGVDLPTVMRVSGHKSVKMIMRYAHQDDAHVRQAMDKLEARLG
jgi:integrase